MGFGLAKSGCHEGLLDVEGPRSGQNSVMVIIELGYSRQPCQAPGAKVDI